MWCYGNSTEKLNTLSWGEKVPFSLKKIDKTKCSKAGVTPKRETKTTSWQTHLIERQSKRHFCVTTPIARSPFCIIKNLLSFVYSTTITNDGWSLPLEFSNRVDFAVFMRHFTLRFLQQWDFPKTETTQLASQLSGGTDLCFLDVRRTFCSHTKLEWLWVSLLS